MTGKEDCHSCPGGQGDTQVLAAAYFLLIPPYKPPGLPPEVHQPLTRKPTYVLVPSGTLTSITNLATSLARNMDRLSLDEEHYNRQEEWRRQLPESLGEGLRQGLSRLGISLLGKRLDIPVCLHSALEAPPGMANGFSWDWL